MFPKFEFFTKFISRFFVNGAAEEVFLVHGDMGKLQLSTLMSSS